jgi:hypothetical protein
VDLPAFGDAELMECFFAKSPNSGLMPVGPEAERFLASLRAGGGVTVSVVSLADARLLRKLFSLFELAFDAWEPNEDLIVRGESARKDFDQFRKDVLILAGHYNRYVNARGEVRLEAKSLSPAKCEGVDLQCIYRKVLDVVWSRILRHVRYASPAEAERVIEKILTYEGGDHAYLL